VDKRKLLLALLFSYVFLAYIVLMVIGASALQVGRKSEAIKATISYLWIISIASLITVFILYISTRKLKIAQ